MPELDKEVENLIKKVEVNIADNKTIAEMVDGNLKVEHYYKNEIIIEKPVRIEVDVINTITLLIETSEAHHQYLKIMYHLGQTNRRFKC